MPIRLIACRPSTGKTAPPRARVGRFAGAAALAAAMLPLAACDTLPAAGEPEPVHPAKAQKSLRLNDEDFARLGYRRDWTSVPYVAEGLGIRYFQPFDDAVVIQDGSSTVTVLDASNGKRRWHNTVANRLTQFVGLVRLGNMVHASSESEVFTLDLATGQIVGREQLARLVSTAPAVTQGLFIYGTGTGQIVAHLIGRNLTAWQNATEGGLRVNPVLVGSAVAFVSQQGRILFLDAATGSRIGETAIYDGPVVNPAASDSLVFIASQDQSLYAFVPGGVRPVWRKRTNAPLRYAPVHHDGVVYCTIPEQGLTAFDAITGQEKWSVPDVRGHVVGVRAGRLLAWTGTDAATIDPAHGDIIDRVTLPGFERLTPDAFVDGNLYAVSGEGVVVKFLPRR